MSTTSPVGGNAGEVNFIARHRTMISVAVHALLIALALLIAFGLAHNFHNVFPHKE